MQVDRRGEKVIVYVTS